MSVRIITGDSRDVLRTLAPASVDAIVTDPPAGISFMGKDWDHDKGGRDAWIAWLTGILAECYRVAKPGAHAVVWALPRTSGWTHRALEDAGWEVRDCICHLFGSGFPKSLDVSRAIDKAAGAERETWDVPRNGGPGGKSDHIGQISAERKSGIGLASAPATPDAERWQGWGTALKPAAEFWYLARKPLIGTVAANVLAHGTGALNIDGSRIEGVGNTTFAHRYAGDRPRDQYRTGTASGQLATDRGRWPPNVCLDADAAALLDAMSGERKTGGANGHRRASANLCMAGPNTERFTTNGRSGDTGGASRFFYVAKASRAERGAGNGHPTVKPLALMQWLVRLVTPPGGTVLDPFLGSGTTLVAAGREGFDGIGIELDPTYAEIARRRLIGDAPLFAEVSS